VSALATDSSAEATAFDSVFGLLTGAGSACSDDKFGDKLEKFI
jgi:hypothetical protein